MTVSGDLGRRGRAPASAALMPPTPTPLPSSSTAFRVSLQPCAEADAGVPHPCADAARGVRFLHPLHPQAGSTASRSGASRTREQKSPCPASHLSRPHAAGPHTGALGVRRLKLDQRRRRRRPPAGCSDTLSRDGPHPPRPRHAAGGAKSWSACRSFRAAAGCASVGRQARERSSIPSSSRSGSRKRRASLRNEWNSSRGMPARAYGYP